jgi:hypothetical protein
VQSEHGKILLAIENENENPVTVSTDIILHDGFTSNKFKVIDKNTSTVLPYMGKNVKYILFTNENTIFIFFMDSSAHVFLYTLRALTI